MFKKSELAGVKLDYPFDGTIVFGGYAEIRVTPKNPPPALKQRLKAGRDVIAIWFQHSNAALFKDLDEWDDIKIINRETGTPTFLPKIEDMSTHQILAFCKSIDVHPAHLVPLDRDYKLSLPTSLLELLVEMAYPEESGRDVDLYDTYLAKAAIAFECKRIRDHLRLEKILPVHEGKKVESFSVMFEDVLGRRSRIMDMGAAKMPPSKSFGIHASRSYPYVERVRDMAIINADIDYKCLQNAIEDKKEIVQGRIRRFIHTYNKLVDPEAINDMAGALFLEDVLQEIEHKAIPKEDAPLEDIGEVIQSLLDKHVPYHDHVRAYHRLSIDKLGVKGIEPTPEDENYLRQMDDLSLEKLAADVRHIFNSEANLIAAKKKHAAHIPEYLERVEKIHKDFYAIRTDYEHNLLNNRVLLGVNNISIQIIPTPASNPK